MLVNIQQVIISTSDDPILPIVYMMTLVPEAGISGVDK